MNEGPINPNNDMVETTDSLEAVGVFRGWKNLFFIVMFLCLLLTQVAFWTVNSGLIKAPAISQTELGTPAADLSGAGGTPAPAPAVATAPADANQAGSEKGKSTGLVARSMGKFDFARLAHTIAMTNGILLATAILYCLVLTAGLTISLAGRLGGINQVSRAVVLSLIVVVLLMLQRLLGPAVPGVIWTPEELVRWLAVKNDSTWNVITFYLRFTLYWVVALVLLLLAQIRSARWSRAILRRLEIM
jgi:hypothetical protein